MATFRLDNLRARAQQASDNVSSNFVASTGSAPVEWTQLINDAYFETYGVIVGAFEDYYVANPYTFTTDGVNDLFALPTDFYKMLGVDLQVSGAAFWVTLKEYAFAERNQLGLVNSPIPSAGQTLRLWYVPALTPLVADADLTVDLANGWDALIVTDAAMRALAKEEADVSVLMAQKQALIARIQSEAANRDAGTPPHIIDHYAARSPAMRYHIQGAKIRLQGGNTPLVPYGDCSGMDW